MALPRSRLASAYALGGETESAAAELSETRRLDGENRFSIIARLKAFPGAWLVEAETRAFYENTYFDGLRRAGMPDK